MAGWIHDDHTGRAAEQTRCHDCCQAAAGPIRVGQNDDMATAQDCGVLTRGPFNVLLTLEIEYTAIGADAGGLVSDHLFRGRRTDSVGSAQR